MKIYSRVIFALAVLMPALACPLNPSLGGVEVGMEKMEGFKFSLSEGQAPPPPMVAVPRAEGRPLSEAEVKALLDRLPSLDPDIAAQETFSLPPETLPAPKAGQTIDRPFPPETAEQAPERFEGPLEVLRFSPEGDVPLAPRLSLTFSQPMVELTSHEDLETREAPIKLTPEPEGRWRWVGTKTLVFEPRYRFPMATEYRVEVPAGTAAPSGGRLEKAVRWRFTTPPPTIDKAYPSDSVQGLDPLIFIGFDQQIDSEKMLDKLEVMAGPKKAAIRRANKDDIQADENVSRMVEDAKPGRWLAFRPEKPLSPATDIIITVPAGSPSAEGPLLTPKERRFSFRTYDPLVIDRVSCGWGDQCPPMTPWVILSNNPLDESAFDPSMVTVTPELPDRKIEVHHNRIRISGLSSGRTKYKITFDSAIRDVFGQSPVKTQTVEVKVGSAHPFLMIPAGDMVVLDPAAKPVHHVYTINYERLNVRIYSVEPEDYVHFQHIPRYPHSRVDRDKTIGQVVHEEEIRIKARPDEMVRTEIDLSPRLKNGLGHLVVKVEAKLGDFKSLFGKERRREPERYTWVESTGLGLDAFYAREELVVWVNSLRDGSPISGAGIQVYPRDVEGVTGSDGLANLRPLSASLNRNTYLIAQKGADKAILPFPNFGIFQNEKAKKSLIRWYVFDDRNMYRPGETVHFKGWIRQIDTGKLGGVRPMDDAIKELKYTIIESRGNELKSGTLKINAFGGFDLSYALPDDINLGRAMLRLEVMNCPDNTDGQSKQHDFQVQEFRRPEFEVKTQVSEGPHLIGGKALVTVSAGYYAGGTLPSADVKWVVWSKPGYFTPPGWSGYVFGEQHPWFMDFHEPFDNAPIAKNYHGQTDTSGEHQLFIDFQDANPPRPTVVEAEASVMDVNRQEWTSASNLLVHPSEMYVGLKSDRLFVEIDEPYPLQAIVTDLDGNPVPGVDIKLDTVRLDWVYKDGEWKEVEAGFEERTLTSGQEPLDTVFKFSKGGRYRLTARIEDSEHRENRTVITAWVAGGKRPAAKNVEQEEVTLITDRSEYQPGDTAGILVQSPFQPAEGLLSYRCNGLVKVDRFRMEGPSHTIKVPIEASYIPNLHVQVDLVGAASRVDDEGRVREDAPKRPAFASGSINLRVPPLSEALDLEVRPQNKKLEPGAKTSVELLVKDASGQPVENSEIALVVVDEAVLALTGYQLTDPLDVFYRERNSGVWDYHSRDKIKLADFSHLIESSRLEAETNKVRSGVQFTMKAAPSPMDAYGMAEMSPAPMAMAEMDAPGAEAKPIFVRKDFNPLAVFAPEARTDVNGRARVEFQIPDNLTRYRVMAVAVAGDKYFGMGESTITARLPLMVRPSPPRFLRVGDRLELPVVLHNQTDDPLDIDVALRAANCRITDGSGFRVAVPAEDRVEIRFPVKTESAGQAMFQAGAASGPWADASEHKLPVYTPATTEAMAVYGEVDQGAIAQPIAPPQNAFTEFGGLEITASSTALQALTDAVVYLVSYPFDCSEQIASRIMAVAALKDMLPAFNAQGLPSPEKIEEAVLKDIERLKNLQNQNGGFPVWERGRESWPFHSVHVMHALARAQKAGFDVPETTVNNGMEYIRRIERHIPNDYSPKLRHTVEAYAVYVRFLLGDDITTGAQALIEKAGLKNLSLEDLGWLLYAIGNSPKAEKETMTLQRLIGNRVDETASTAHFVTSYGEESYLLLHSNRRTDAILLEALIKVDPQNDLIPKIVRGLMAHRKRGRWSNTQENAFVLLALKGYFEEYEAQTPDFVARVWLGKRFAGQAEFKGRSADSRRIRIPMSYLASQGPQDILLSKDGPGRLYYRLGLRYAPKNLDIKPADHGFAVERTYEAVDDPEDVRRDKDGVWRVKAGARVKVKITMAAPSRRYHVALADPLPAGFEPLNPALAVTGRLPQEKKRPVPFWWWWRPWYEHQNMRDDRVEAFASLLWSDVHTYTYYARAVTPGRFIAGPTKAEEMYAPETFGRAHSEVVVVE